MKKFSSALCAFTCLVGATSVANAIESSQAINAKNSNNIDIVLNELSRQQQTPSLVQTSFEPTSLATNSSLLSSNTIGNEADNKNLLSHLTLVASNAVSRFKQTGHASWYGGKFHGRKTASGERFNMHSMTAAHRSLPFNTYLKVTNKNNGKSVVVKVNDRGPFHGNRILDLSYGAAKKIGLVNRGVGNVVVERVTSP